ncbi:MAG TPA: hypothetical protein DIT67_10865 [Octadecabacter sp.]|nr:hypothetical protein [Octadecabacter sp.]
MNITILTCGNGNLFHKTLRKAKRVIKVRFRAPVVIDAETQIEANDRYPSKVTKWYVCYGL